MVSFSSISLYLPCKDFAISFRYVVGLAVDEICSVETTEQSLASARNVDPIARSSNPPTWISQLLNLTTCQINE